MTELALRQNVNDLEEVLRRDAQRADERVLNLGCPSPGESWPQIAASYERRAGLLDRRYPARSLTSY
jgi:hypothetical protein